MAVVEGNAIGAGADLALACDCVLVRPSATFRFPGMRFGLVLGVARLAELLGRSRAVTVAWDREEVTGAELAQWGIAQVTSDAWPEELREWWARCKVSSGESLCRWKAMASRRDRTAEVEAAYQSVYAPDFWTTCRHIRSG